MPNRIGRRPYTDCPYRWSLTVAGVEGAVAPITEGGCVVLNGTFLLDFKACVSKTNLLIWEDECLPGRTGVLAHQRIQGTWHLEYNIDDAKWTLHAFPQYHQPVYTLIDSEPCVYPPEPKILTREDEEGEGGCSEAPLTVTITPACPDIRLVGSITRARAIDDINRRVDGRTGKTHRKIGRAHV